MPLDNRISLKKLEVFCAVVENESVSAAAQELMIAQPGVSAHLRTLEERLGVKLLDRDRGRLALTEAGRSVHRWAQDVLSRSNELAREIDGLVDGKGGSAVIAASMTAGTYVLTPLLIQFRRSRPQAAISLTISQPELALETTEAGDADFCVVHIEHPDARGSLVFEHLCDEELILIAPLATERTEVTIDQLAEVPFVCAPVGQTRRRMFDRVLARNGVENRKVIMSFGNAESILRAVREGVGIALIFRSSIERSLKEAGVRQITVTGKSMTLPLFLAYRGDKHFSRLQLDLMKSLKESMTAEIAAGTETGSDGDS